MKRVILLALLIASCKPIKTKSPYFIQYEKYFCLNTEYNVRYLNEIYGSQIINSQFIIESDSIWNIYQSDSSAVVMMFPNIDTTNYIYTSNINRYKYKKL